MLKTGLLTLSDRAKRGEYEDQSGPVIRDVLTEWVATPIEFDYSVLPDNREDITRQLIHLADVSSCSLILTTGGTGPAVRDVTPEATEAVCEKMLPGFGELMRQVSLQFVPTAILSRQTAGIRGATLIVNLPGKPKAIRECLEPIIPAIPDCLDLIGGPSIELKPEKGHAYRPH